MSTAFVAICDAIEALLQTAPAASSYILRGSRREVPDGRADQVNILLLDADPQQSVIHGAPIDWITRVAVECYTRAAAINPEVLVDPILAEIYSRIAADVTLGGVVQEIRPPKIRWDVDDQGIRTGWTTLLYEIAHTTNNLTLD